MTQVKSSRERPQPASPPQAKDAPQRSREDFMKVVMDPVETGERVLRGIRRNDLYIHTHPEFRNGYVARHDAVIRAIPDEPPRPERWEIMKNFGTIIYNDIYDRQPPVGPPDW